MNIFLLSLKIAQNYLIKNDTPYFGDKPLVFNY